MTIEMIPLNQIKPWDDNPRKSFDADTIEGLATSIKQDGLLQNLVVFKLNRKKQPYRLISGERRYRALSLLVERGDLPKDFEVPCDIRESINHSDAHRLATIENIQRENLTPLEEADAIAVLLQGNIDPQEVMAKTGLSLSTLKRRLALSGLCEEARIALCEKTISLAKAEALTLGSHDQQRDMLEREVAYFSADDIKHHLTYEKPSVALAIFKREEYQGSVTSDLFAEDETTYFDDEEEFWALQMKAVRACADEYREKGFDPVEIIEGYHFNSWEYREAEEGETGGVYIHVRSSGTIEFHENLIARELDNVIELEEKPKRPEYSKPLCEYIAMHKSVAVQKALLDNPRIAREVAIVQMLSGYQGVKLHFHKALAEFADHPSPPETFQKVKEGMELLYTILDPSKMVSEDMQSSYGLYGNDSKAINWYDALKCFTDKELEEFHLNLTVLCFGQYSLDKLDTDPNSLFNRVAQNLGVDMREHWKPDETFLKRRNVQQISDILSESGLEKIIGNGKGNKKSTLIEAVTKQFTRLQEKDDLSEEEQAILNWLPGVFEFPAIDPDAEQSDELRGDFAEAA